MSLQLRFNNIAETFKSGRGFRALYRQPPGEGVTFEGMVAFNDLMSRVLGGSYFYVPSFSRTSSQISGLVGAYNEDVTYKVSGLPYTRQYDPIRDHNLYDSFYTNLRLFSTFLTGVSYDPPSHDRENNVIHTTYSGELTTEQVDISTWVEDYDFYGYHFDVHNFHSDVWGGAYVNNVSPLQVIPVSWSLGWSGYKFFNILDILDNLIDKTVDMTELQQGSYYVNHVLSNIEYDLSYSGLVINYHQRTVGITAGGVFEWDGKIIIPFQDCSPTVYPIVGQVYYPNFVGTVEYQFLNGSATAVLTHALDYDMSPKAGKYVSHSDNPIFHTYLSSPAIHDLVEQKARAYWAYSQLQNGRFLKPFKDAVDKDMFSIAASSLFSSVDAYKKAEGYLGSNVLQNLAKIPSISSAMPKVGEALDILSSFAKRDLRSLSPKKILDFLSSTTLQANFQWRPYKDIVESYLPQMMSTIHSLGDIEKNAVGYGSFRHKFTNEFTRKEVTLLTRTKIVIDASPSELLSAVLGIDALGLLPKASNIWDLIPFSFAANWFTGVGEAIRRAEYSLFLANVPAYYVHTYTITSPFTDDELEILKVSDSMSKRASLRLYYRDISLYSPYPRDTRFGFGIPTQLPPLGTLGSLLYQLIFS